MDRDYHEDIDQAKCIKVEYCRDVLGGMYDIDRVLHSIYGGHGGHYFEHRSWIFKKDYYWCPGREHKHFWDAVGPIFDPHKGARIVENCRCGEERVRTIA